MSYSAPHEEETLSTYFDKNQPAPGGDTSQLRAACDFLQQLIVQELCGNLANAPSFDDLWIHFPTILARIFGKQDSTTSGPTGGGPITGVYGGSASSEENSWMFAATSFYATGDKLSDHSAIPSAGARAAPSSRSASTGGGNDKRLCCMSSAEAVPLLSLLLAGQKDQSSSSNKNLFGVLLEGREVYYNFSCASPPMPPHTLAFLSFGGPLRTVLFQNSRLYTSCLSKLPRAFKSDVVHPHAFGFPTALGGGNGAAGGVVAADGAKTTPALSLSPLELYLFSFAWYALSSASDFYAGLGGPGRVNPHQYSGGAGGGSTSTCRPERVALGWRRYGVKGLTHRNAYMVLVKDYMEAFFPHGAGTVSIGGSGDSLNGVNHRSELFLRILMEFWLEGNAVLRPGFLKQEEQTAPPYHHQQHHHQVTWDATTNASTNTPHLPPGASPRASPRMTDNYDPTAAILASDFTAPSDVSLHGLLIVSAHLLADPRLPGACCHRLQSASGGGGRGGSDAPVRFGALGWRGGGAGTGAVSGGALTPSLDLLRPHVFAFLRVMFSAESGVHVGSSVFSLAVELWLLWMRPWAAPGILAGGSPRASASSKHTASVDGNSRGRPDSSTTRSSTNGGGGGGDGSWVSSMVEAVRDFWKYEPETAPQNADLGRRNLNSGGGAGGARAGAIPGRVGGRRGSYSYDPWAGWVLENYSLYTTIMVSFTRRAANMSFKVDDRPSGGMGVGGGWGEAGRRNVELVWRVAEAFGGDVAPLLELAQNTVRQSREQGGGGGSTADVEVLHEAEQEVLEEGRQAFVGIQGPHLVTLEGYRESAEELLACIMELASPTQANDWASIMARKVGLSVKPTRVQRQVEVISSQLKQLYGLPHGWRPKGHGEQGAAGRSTTSLAEMCHPDREKKAPAFLSRQGQAQLASGRKTCKPWDVSYIGDPLYHPRRTWEPESLIKFWVGVSENINSRWLGWPSELGEDGGGAGGSAPFDDEGPSRAISLGKEFQRRAWGEGPWAGLPRRLNLRPFADVRVTLCVAIAVYLLLVAFRVSATFGASFATALLVLCLRVSVVADSV